MSYYEDTIEYYETTSPEDALKETWIKLFASVDPLLGETMWNEFSTSPKYKDLYERGLKDQIEHHAFMLAKLKEIKAIKWQNENEIRHPFYGLPRWLGFTYFILMALIAGFFLFMVIHKAYR